MNFSRQQQGDIYVLVSAVFWGLFPVITILSYNDVSPFISLTISSFFAAVYFSLAISIKKKWHELLNFSVYKYILGVTLTNGILYYLLIFTALKFTSAGNVAIVGLTEIGFSFLFFHVLRKEHLPKMHILGAILMIAGALIVLLPNFTSFKFGDALVVMAAAIAPFGNFFVQRARKKVISEIIMLIRSIVAAFIIFLISIFLQTPMTFDSIKNSWPFLFVNGVFVFGLTRAMWIEGIHRISVPKANALASIAPFFTLVFAFFFLKQIPTIWQLLSIFPICAGVILLSRVKTNPPTVPEAD